MSGSGSTVLMQHSSPAHLLSPSNEELPAAGPEPESLRSLPTIEEILASPPTIMPTDERSPLLAPATQPDTELASEEPRRQSQVGEEIQTPPEQPSPATEAPEPSADTPAREEAVQTAADTIEDAGPQSEATSAPAEVEALPQGPDDLAPLLGEEPTDQAAALVATLSEEPKKDVPEWVLFDEDLSVPTEEELEAVKETEAENDAKNVTAHEKLIFTALTDDPDHRPTKVSFSIPLRFYCVERDCSPCL